MSVHEIQTLAQRFADAFDKRDMKTTLEMLPAYGNRAILPFGLSSLLSIGIKVSLKR